MKKEKRADFFNFRNFPYGYLEVALSRAYGFYPNNVLLIRSKMKNFRKIHVGSGPPGEGQKFSYSMYELCYWGFVFELVEIGLPPNLIKNLMPSYLRDVQGHVIEIVDLEDEDFFVWLEASFLFPSRQVDDQSQQRTFTVCTSKEICSLVNEHDKDRLILINLSKFKLRIQDAMQDVFENSGRYFEVSYL